MAFTNVNIGTSADSGTGDTIRAAFTTINGNFLTINNAIGISGNTINAPVIVNVSSSSDAFRITQTGAGNSFVVEDSANPDSTPFIIDASGNVGIANTSPNAKLAVTGTANISGNVVIGGVLTSANLTLTTNTTTIGTTLYVVSGGNVGISNTAPNAKLQVSGTANVSGNVIIGGSLTSANLTTTTNTANIGTTIYVVAGGNVGISNTAPDAKLAVTGTANISGNMTIGANLTVSTNTFTLGSSTKAANGYTYLPNGIKMNWGWISANSSDGNAQFTSAFTTVYNVQTTSNATGTYIASGYAPNTTHAIIRTSNTTSTNVYWMAIGV
jgi:hypothetical protein